MVPVDLLQAPELGVLGRRGVCVGPEVDDAHRGPRVGRLLHQRQQMRGQHHVPDVVDRHVLVDAGRGGGVRNALGRVVDQDVEPVGAGCDGLGGAGDRGPVGEVDRGPLDPSGGGGAQLGADRGEGVGRGAGGLREDEQFRDVVLQQRVGAAVANALGAFFVLACGSELRGPGRGAFHNTIHPAPMLGAEDWILAQPTSGHNGNFALQIGHLVQRELVILGRKPVAVENVGLVNMVLPCILTVLTHVYVDTGPTCL